jgi:hypothetical protein
MKPMPLLKRNNMVSSNFSSKTVIYFSKRVGMEMSDFSKGKTNSRWKSRERTSLGVEKLEKVSLDFEKKRRKICKNSLD